MGDLILGVVITILFLIAMSLFLFALPELYREVKESERREAASKYARSELNGLENRSSSNERER